MNSDTSTLLHRPLFDALLPGLLVREGGARITNDPSDAGGVTKWGVSLRWLRTQGALGDTDDDGDVDADDVRALSRDEAAEHYWRAFWLQPGWYTLPRLIAAKLLDLGVNAGTGTAIRLLQRACTALGREVTIDGRLGPQTRTAAQTLPPLELAHALCVEQAMHYGSLIGANQKLQKYRLGWSRRAAWLPSAAELGGELV